MSKNSTDTSEYQSVFDVLEKLAHDGDLAGVIRMLTAERSCVGAKHQAKYTQIAIEAARAKNRLTDDLLSMAIAMDAELYTRLLLIVKLKLSSADSLRASEPVLEIPKDMLPYLEHLAKIEDRLVVLARARNSIQHVDALAKHGPGSRSGRVIKLEDAQKAGDQYGQAAGE